MRQVLRKAYGAGLHFAAAVVLLVGVFGGSYLMYRFFKEPTQNDRAAAHRICDRIEDFIAKNITAQRPEIYLEPFGSNLTINLELPDVQVQYIASNIRSIESDFGPFKTITLRSGRFTRLSQDLGNGVSIGSREFSASKTFRIQK